MAAIEEADPIGAFIRGGDGARDALGGGFLFTLEVLTQRRKEVPGSITSRVAVTPSSSLRQLLAAVSAATVADSRPNGVPPERLLLMSAGSDLLAKARASAGDAGLNEDGLSMSLFELGALESVEGAVYAQVFPRCTSQTDAS